MMEAVLISIQPKWVEKIANGKKTIEVRKTKPKLETPFKVCIYATWNGSKKEILVKQDGQLFCEDWKKANGLQRASGKIIGEFVCDRIDDISVVVRNCNEDYNHVYHNDECKGSCLTWKELQEYGKGKTLYSWHITDLKIYDKPKDLSEFMKYCFQYGKVDCHECMQWGQKNIFCLRQPITRPPQSWCYVEV